MIIRFALVLLLVGAGTARADEDKSIAGTYTVELSEVQNSCTSGGLNAPPNATLTLTAEATGLRAVLGEFPAMKGAAEKGGKFHAETTAQKTRLEGMTGSFSVAGRITGKDAQLVFVVELFKGASPSCTQSWNAKGKKS